MRWARSAQVLVAVVPVIYMPRDWGEGCNSPPLGTAQLGSMQKATNHVFLLITFSIGAVSVLLWKVCIGNLKSVVCNKTSPSLHPFISRIQKKMRGPAFVHKHCHKAGIFQIKAVGFAPRLLSIHQFPRESYIFSEPFFRDERCQVPGCLPLTL